MFLNMLFKSRVRSPASAGHVSLLFYPQLHPAAAGFALGYLENHRSAMRLIPRARARKSFYLIQFFSKNRVSRAGAHKREAKTFAE